MRVAPVLCCLALTLSMTGCRPKTYQPFYALEADQSTLISREGDDAYVSPALEPILAGLDAVPENAREKARALELAARLRAEQSRVRLERVPKEKVAQGDPFEGRLAPQPLKAAPPPEPAPVAAGPVDAGPPEPFAGMSEKDFVAKFGRCFAAGAPSTGDDGGAATTQVVIDDAACQKRFGQPGVKTSFVFTAAGLWGTRTQTQTRVETPEAPKPAPVPVAAADAGERVLLVPGAPIPEGYRKQTDP